MKIDTSMTGKLVKYITILFISLALFGAIIPFVTSEKYFTDALGFGIIMVSCFGGMGMAFFVRRRDAIKTAKKQTEIIRHEMCPQCKFFNCICRYRERSSGGSSGHGGV